MRPALACLCACIAAPAAGGPVVCPDSSNVTLELTCTYTGAYRAGEPKDIVTVAPNDLGETLAEAGITIRVQLRDCDGAPVAGIPAASIQIELDGANVCACAGGNPADGPTDANGATTFSGRIRAGGCGTSATVRVDGVVVGSVPLRFNSPDRGPPACGIEVHDVNPFIFQYGATVGTAEYSICPDLNEDGVLDASDMAIQATAWWASCTFVAKAGP